ncbi:hypothetical protein LPTSP3_g21300 [Leptospira kobayashii]|uniref:WbqC-like protein n=1 Tax=Leptospira kobayashii TaxID=1917830 RepID=A0ABM7URV3_9LEPT|nr:WbqC family protein [Leptospira kobayashii]BDA79200.1 hypothetical protein LPTSP3_g21300 [Leptospira kobayashii]
MIVSIHQPAFNGWLGYYEKIIRSDVFVYLDTVQFEKNSFTNRNKIKTNAGELWLTIPVKLKGHIDQTIKDIQIDNSTPWRKKHLKTIELNYRKAPRFDKVFSSLESIYNSEHTDFALFCYEFLIWTLKDLNIKTKIVRASDLEFEGNKSDLVLNICKKLNAKTYISGIFGKDYLNLDDFQSNQIEVLFQDYKHPLYPQIGKDFISHLGILDFLFNTDDLSIIYKG